MRSCSVFAMAVAARIRPILRATAFHSARPRRPIVTFSVRPPFFRAIAVVISLSSGCASGATVKPNGLFTEGAILQREIGIPIWGTASEGEKIIVTLRDRRAITVTKNGKWMVVLPPMSAGGPYSLTINGENRITLSHIFIGDVYICTGQSNMEWPLSLSSEGESAVSQAEDPLLHLYTVPKSVSDTRLTDVSGAWRSCTGASARGFSAVAYFFGRSLRRHLGVPIGLIQSTWSGTPAQAWTSRATLESIPALSPMVAAYDRDRVAYREAVQNFEAAFDRDPRDAELVTSAEAQLEYSTRPPINPTGEHSPATLFNAMISPLIPYAMRGVICYQGESDAGAAYQYETLFPAMIGDWRAEWKQGNFPFLFVQCAPFMKRQDSPRDSAWAELREAQRLTSRNVENSGMAVITDLGDENDIHPRDKQPVGERLALLARALVYHEEIEAVGPAYVSMKTEGDKVVLSFQHVDGGLEAQGSETLNDFEVAGEDELFVNATAVIHGDTVVVSSPQVLHPIAVRYGWADYPQGNLRNRAGFPASPFRTDRFPMSTMPNYQELPK